MRALAKLTRSLRITGVRPDGYHELDAEMVTVDLADELTFDEGDGLEVTGPAATGVPVEGNLVAKALAARRSRVAASARLPRLSGSFLKLRVSSRRPACGSGRYCRSHRRG